MTVNLKKEIESLIGVRCTEGQIKQSQDYTYTVELDGDTVCCITPLPLAEDFNNAFSTKSEALAWLVTVRELHPDGKNWNIDPSLKHECAEHLYDLLANVCINDDEEIDEEFLHFEKGTDRSEIWHWIESEFEISISSLEGMS